MLVNTVDSKRVRKKCVCEVIRDGNGLRREGNVRRKKEGRKEEYVKEKKEWEMHERQKRKTTR